jgi:hypothetical protein
MTAEVGFKRQPAPQLIDGTPSARIKKHKTTSFISNTQTCWFHLSNQTTWWPK